MPTKETIDTKGTRILHVLNDRFETLETIYNPTALCGQRKSVDGANPVYSMKGLLLEPAREIYNIIESMCKDCEEHELYPFVVLAALS